MKKRKPTRVYEVYFEDEESMPPTYRLSITRAKQRFNDLLADGVGVGFINHPDIEELLPKKDEEIYDLHQLISKLLRWYTNPNYCPGINHPPLRDDEIKMLKEINDDVLAEMLARPGEY